MVIEDIKSYLADDWLAVQNGIRAALGTDISLLADINSSLLGNEGKQLRPMILLLLARAMVGNCNQDTIQYAVASELLHNATLLHDDVADNSDQRRGHPTLRKIMGAGTSVLVGDFWLVSAMSCVMKADRGRNKAITMFCGTLSDLVQGEMFQLQKAGSLDTDFNDYMETIYRKTASLFRTAALAAAISVDAPQRLEDAASQYGSYIGYAFQMRDDIFDYMEDASPGKPVGIDILEKKITLPLLGAFKNAGKQKEEQVRRIIRNIEGNGRSEIISFVRENGGIEYAQSILEEYVDKAVSALEAFPLSRDREILAELANYVAVRTI